MALKTRRLGTTDIEVTELGFGGAPLGAVGTHITESFASGIVQTAFDAGIRFFDTAPLYGHGLSEKRLGVKLRTLDRVEFVLSTKVGRLLVPRGQGIRDANMRDNEPFNFRYDYSYAAARQSLESSLGRLGLDRIDILLCHDIDSWTHGEKQDEVYKAASQGILPALVDMRDEGLIGAFGLGVNECQVCVEVMEEFMVDCFLLAGRFTLLEQDALDEMLPNCVEKNVSVIIGGPFNSGLLATDNRKGATYDYKPVDDERWEKAQEIRFVCNGHSVDVRAAALQYPLRHPAVASVIPGMWSLREVQANISLMDVEIPDALWQDLAAAGLTRGI